MHGDNGFTKNDIKMLVKHLISETYFHVGNKLFRQCKGVPTQIAHDENATVGFSFISVV